MAREYFLAYHSYLNALEPLGEAERGRLFTALLTYSSTGQVPPLPGNERFIFPMMKGDIDRSTAAYQEVCQRNHENGKKGGRPRKAAAEQTQNPENPSGFSKTQKSQSECECKGECEGKGEGECKGDGESTSSAAKPRRARPEHPTEADAIAYFTSQGSNPQEAQHFCDYYTANGWRVGKNPMKDWKAAARNWIKNTPLYGAPASSQKAAAASSRRPGPRDVTRPASEAQSAQDWMSAAAARRRMIKKPPGSTESEGSE